MFYFDYTIWLLIPVFIFAIYAQNKVKSTFPDSARLFLLQD
jgi:Zn-dependent membrane protease YugP